jgi:hypothetical protein
MKKIYIFNNISKNNNEKGMALLATLIFVFVLGTIGIAMLTMASNDSKLSTLQRESNRAFYLAETGIEEALWFMNLSTDNPDGINWRVPKLDSEGERNFWPKEEDRDSNTEYYEVNVTDIPATGKEKIKIESTGIVDNSSMYNDGRRTVEVILEKGMIQNDSLSYNYAILADSIVNFKGTAPYVNGDIHSNGDVDSRGNFEVTNGTLSASGTINGYEGGIYQDIQPVPQVNFNQYYEKAVQSGTVYEDDLILDSDTVLEGFHYIKGDLRMKAPAKEIIIRNGAIFVDGKVDYVGNPTFKIEHSDDWDNPLALVAKGDIEFGGTVEGEGIIQSESSILFHGDVALDPGAVVAPEVTLKGSVEIVYDNGLQEEIVVGTGIEVWKKVSWEEI